MSVTRTEFTDRVEFYDNVADLKLTIQKTSPPRVIVDGVPPAGDTRTWAELDAEAQLLDTLK